MTSETIPVTITYQKAGSQPPVFLAGSFSDPAWAPQEMSFTTDEHGEHTFHKEVFTEEGSTIQYKFRIGQGDWWVLDEDAQTVTDEMGNRNNQVRAAKNPLIPGTKSGEGPTASQAIPKPVHKDLLAVLRQDSPVPRSDASTPDFARTAAEVADSAALLDKEDPVPDLPDDEAGRLGFRRLTATPIKEVAKTAAEVADTAQILDAEEAEEDAVVLDAPPPLFAHERLGPDEDAGPAVPEETHNGPPMFAYECIGAYKNDTVPHEDVYASERDRSGSVDYDLDEFDLEDPTLERFPSNREEILETVRKIETGLEEDRPYFEGVPPSPVVGPGLSLDDLGIDQLSTSPSVSPVVPRAVRRLGIPRVSLGSESPERSASVASLHSIVEESGADGEDEDDVPDRPGGAPADQADRLHTSSDDDEGIALNIKGPKRSVKAPDEKGASGQATPQRAPSPGRPRTPVKATEEPKVTSPRIVVHSAESTENGRDASSVPKPNGAANEVVKANAAASSTETTQIPQHSYENPTQSRPEEDAPSYVNAQQNADQAPTEPSGQPDGRKAAQPVDTATSSSVEPSTTGAETKAVKRSGGEIARRPATPMMVFVDWIGGFIQRLFGGGRQE